MKLTDTGALSRALRPQHGLLAQPLATHSPLQRFLSQSLLPQQAAASQQEAFTLLVGQGRRSMSGLTQQVSSPVVSSSSPWHGDLVQAGVGLVPHGPSAASSLPPSPS